jgi:hypothetical protein
MKFCSLLFFNFLSKELTWNIQPEELWRASTGLIFVLLNYFHSNILTLIYLVFVFVFEHQKVLYCKKEKMKSKFNFQCYYLFPKKCNQIHISLRRKFNLAEKQIINSRNFSQQNSQQNVPYPKNLSFPVYTHIRNIIIIIIPKPPDSQNMFVGPKRIIQIHQN